MSTAPTARWNLKRRLRHWLWLGIALLWLIASGCAGFIMHNAIDRVFDSALQELAQRILALAADDLRQRQLNPLHSGNPRIEAMGQHQEHLIYQIRDRAGRVLLASHDAPLTPFAIPLAAGFYDLPEMRGYTQLSLDQQWVVQVVEPHNHRHTVLQQTLLALLLPVIALLGLVGWLVQRIISRLIEPIDDLQQDITARDGHCLDPITTPDLPDELQPIADSVNRLLHTVATALESERAFAANSAHELRTPLAAALAQTEMLLQETQEPAQRQRLGSIASSLQHLGRLAEKLLQLARAQSGNALLREPVELNLLARLLVDEYARQSTFQGRIHLETLEDSPVIAGDLDALAIAVRNLLDNAFKHGGPQVQVWLRVAEPACLCVEDDGRGIPASERDALRQRFQQGREAGKGTGLGLSIVEAVVHQHGGTLSLHDGRATADTLGLCVMLSFPPLAC